MSSDLEEDWMFLKPPGQEDCESHTTTVDPYRRKRPPRIVTSLPSDMIQSPISSRNVNREEMLRFDVRNRIFDHIPPDAPTKEKKEVMFDRSDIGCCAIS